MSDEPTKAQQAELKRLQEVATKVGRLIQKADRLYESGKLTPVKLAEIQREGDRLVATIGEENMPGWDETLTEYRDEIVLAPERAKLY